MPELYKHLRLGTPARPAEGGARELHAGFSARRMRPRLWGRTRRRRL